MFEKIDTSGDKRIVEEEWLSSVNHLRAWGMKKLNSREASKAFAKVDANGGGVVLFDEFAHWAIKQKLDLEDDDDAEDAGAGGGLIGKSFSTKKRR